MRIDIDKLSESELIDLNNRIVERLRFLKQKRAHVQMLKFKIGDRVTFHPEGLPPHACRSGRSSHGHGHSFGYHEISG